MMFSVHASRSFTFTLTLTHYTHGYLDRTDSDSLDRLARLRSASDLSLPSFHLCLVARTLYISRQRLSPFFLSFFPAFRAGRCFNITNEYARADPVRSRISLSLSRENKQNGGESRAERSGCARYQTVPIAYYGVLHMHNARIRRAHTCTQHSSQYAISTNKWNSYRRPTRCCRTDQLRDVMIKIIFRTGWREFVDKFSTQRFLHIKIPITLIFFRYI